MLVVPIDKDRITTKDGNSYKVQGYTNYKEGGPAVYCYAADKSLLLVYFFDIAEINGTRVEFQKSNKVLSAFGRIARAQQLPQPGDKIVVMTSNISDSDEKQTSKVDSLKLKSKKYGNNRGMFVKDDEGNMFRLAQILDIDRALGGHDFNRTEFLQLYKDYTGV